MATTTIKDGFAGGSDNQLKVNADGSINVDVSGSSGTSNVNLTEVGGSIITLGQSTEAGSLPVTIASNQSPVPVTGTITATNPSVGANNITAPTSSTQIGAQNTAGQLIPLMVDPSGKLLVDTSGTSTVTGTVDANINGLSTFQTSQYVVGSTAVQLTPVPLVNRSSMSIKVKTTTSVDMIYVGNSNSVTTTTGYVLFNGDSLQLDLTAPQVVWAIGTSPGQTVYVMEIGD